MKDRRGCWDQLREQVNSWHLQSGPAHSTIEHLCGPNGASAATETSTQARVSLAPDGTTVIPLPEKDICASARWLPLSVILNVAPGGAPETSTELTTGGSRENTMNGNGPSVLALVSAFLIEMNRGPGDAVERYGITACSVPSSMNVVGRERN